MLTITKPPVSAAMREIGAALDEGFTDTKVTVSDRPVDRVVAPALVVTAGDPLLIPGGTHALWTVGLGVVIIAGRFDLAGTWWTLLDLAETAWGILETLDGVTLTSLGRVGPVEAAGVDYLAGVLDLTMFHN